MTGVFMATKAADSAYSSTIVDALGALIAAEGSAAHNFVTSEELSKGRHATRNLADVVHYLCTLHGRQPGVVDHAAMRTTHPDARTWLIEAVDGFAVERTFLTKIVVAAGPLPSTPGQAETESAVNGQRHALEMLAKSDRFGCSIGAAAALVLDWRAMRPLLVAAATRLGVEAPALRLPSETDTFAVLAAIGDTPAVERAVLFGAQQILTQHHGLWDLLEARQIARGEY
jgi:hypothetical protein